jgi:hypothetical protein
MSLRPHFIKISDVLVRGIARSTVKREMVRSLRHIAETVDAVMIAEGIERVEDVAALRDLGLRYGQGYYLARPGPGFPTLREDVHGELSSATMATQATALATCDDDDDDDDDRDDRDGPRLAVGSSPRAMSQTIPGNVFGRAEDEVTSDFQITEDVDPGNTENSATRREQATQPVPVWRPLIDDDVGNAEAEPLLDSLRRAPAEKSPDGERGGGQPGLN